MIYGLLLGAFGVGALTGAFLIHPLRQRRGAEFVITVLTAAGGLAFVLIGFAASGVVPVVLALAVAGTAWLGSFSTFNITVQMRTAFWVQARVLSLYQTVVFGGMAIGAWGWGELPSEPASRPPICWLVRCCWAASPCIGCCRLSGGEAPNLQPATRQEPLPTIQAAAEEGPVMVQIEYEVGPANAPAFIAAMDEVGHLRRRNGAVRWRLFQDVADGARWTEVFVLGDWLEHRRLRRRMTMADAALEARAVAYHSGEERRSAATWSPAATTAASCSTRPSRRRSRRAARPTRRWPTSRARARPESPSRHACASSWLPSHCRVLVSMIAPTKRPAQQERVERALVLRPFRPLHRADRLGQVQLLGTAGAGCGRAAGRCGRAGRPRAWRAWPPVPARRARAGNPAAGGGVVLAHRPGLEQVRRHRRAVVAQILAPGPGRVVAGDPVDRRHVLLGHERHLTRGGLGWRANHAS